MLRNETSVPENQTETAGPGLEIGATKEERLEIAKLALAKEIGLVEIGEQEATDGVNQRIISLVEYIHKAN